MEEYREERESNRLNMTSRLNQARRWEERERERMRRKGAKEREREPRKCVAEVAGLCRNEKVGEGKSMSWRGLGQEVG